MHIVRLHYWAGARAAAGTETEEWSAGSIGAALGSARRDRDARFAQILSVCSLLVDETVLHPDDLDRPLSGEVTVEILPPFAGG